MNPADLLRVFKECGVDLATGVPDSLQEEFCTLIASEFSVIKHVAAANEGSAIGLAIGHHLASGNISLVYMQNSGLGNAFNPLISLAHSAIYKIPMILMIGWRGMPGIDDEPQHQVQGAVSTKLLEILDIPFLVASEETSLKAIEEFVSTQIKNDEGPIAILIAPNTFKRKINSLECDDNLLMTRERAVANLLTQLSDQCIFISTTGKLSRELSESRAKYANPNRDFMVVGGMGHASAIALGIAIERTNETVVCLDGDGAALMHLGALAMIGEQKPSNFIHILFNNGVHESVGGQPIASKLQSFTGIARSLKYKTVLSVNTQQELQCFITKSDTIEKPCFVEIYVNTYSRNDLPRPKNTPLQNKQSFMDQITKRKDRWPNTHWTRNQ